MIIPNIWKNKSHVPNHQPLYYAATWPTTLERVLRPDLDRIWLDHLSMCHFHTENVDFYALKHVETFSSANTIEIHTNG